jgi:hypothetical protein
MRTHQSQHRPWIKTRDHGGRALVARRHDRRLRPELTPVEARVLLSTFTVAEASEPRGGILGPASFASLGRLSIDGGSYTVNTNDDTLTGPDGTVLFKGTTSGGVAVFDFDSIVIGDGTIRATGAHPLALLSRGNITMGGGLINVGGNNGSDLFSFDGAAAGPGGSPGGASPTGHSGNRGAGPGGGDGAGHDGGGGGGGGFGGAGGGGEQGANGGRIYGNLEQVLEGGSGGGSGWPTGGGGGGGGAIELGALGNLTINGGKIDARAGNGGRGTEGGGGGSGGAIVLSAKAVSLDGRDVLDVRGGGGGWATAGGGGGGGGRILILADSYNNTGSVNLEGGPRGHGVLTGAGGDGHEGEFRVAPLSVALPMESRAAERGVSLAIAARRSPTEGRRLLSRRWPSSLLTSGAARAFAAAAHALPLHGKPLEAIEQLGGRGHGD